MTLELSWPVYHANLLAIQTCIITVTDREFEMEFCVTAHKGFFEMRLTGDIDPDKYTEVFNTLFAHDEWKPGTPLLVDESDLRADNLTIAGLQAIARTCTNRRAEFGASRMSMYVSRNLEYGLNRMWHVFIEDNWEVVGNVFRSREEAMAWLGV